MPNHRWERNPFTPKYPSGDFVISAVPPFIPLLSSFPGCVTYTAKCDSFRVPGGGSRVTLAPFGLGSFSLNAPSGSRTRFGIPEARLCLDSYSKSLLRDWVQKPQLKPLPASQCQVRRRRCSRVQTFIAPLCVKMVCGGLVHEQVAEEPNPSKPFTAG